MRFPVNDVEVAVISIKKRGVIIETPTEARQAERGPSILVLFDRQRQLGGTNHGRRLVCVFSHLPG